MQQLLKGLKSLSLLGPLLACLFLFNFNSSTISAVLVLIALIYIYKRVISAGIIFLAIALLLNYGITAPVLFYPVIVSFIVFLAFFLSLFSNKCLIHRFAEKMEPDLPEHAISYCYRVNIVWTFFLVTNTIISYLSMNNIKLWSWYNGFISYLLIAILFVCEYAFRQLYIKGK